MNLGLEISKRADNYRRALKGLPPAEGKPKKAILGGKRLSPKARGELVRKLKGRGYFCERCKDWHKLGDKGYRTHLEYAGEVLEERE